MRLPVHFHYAPLLAATIALTTSACGAEKPRDPWPRCVLHRPMPEGFEGEPEEAPQRPLRVEQWAWLIVDKAFGQTATRDCAGQPVRWPSDGCHGVQGPPPKPVPVDESSVIHRRHTSDQRLVWVITHRYENGDGLGPVALVTVQPHRAHVEILGMLRHRTGRVRLSLGGVGPLDLLVAEGETCEDEDDPSTCRRAVRLLARQGRRYEPLGLYHESPDNCVGPALFPMGREETVELDNGWRRHLEYNASLEYKASEIVVHEQILAEDSDPSQPAVPPRTFRELDGRRFIHFGFDGRLYVSERSPWREMVQTRGSTTKRAAPAPEGGDEGGE